MRLRGPVLLCALAPLAAADEGIWFSNSFPAAQVQEKYKFEVTPAFLEHLRLSTVRIGVGDGSFVSSNGFLLTSHHIASDCIAAYRHVQEGFYAPSTGAELPCPDLQADVLVALDDVTARVKGASKRPPSPPSSRSALPAPAISARS